MDVLKETSKSNTTTGSTQHIDSYFGKLTESVDNQLNAVKSAVEKNALQDKTTLEESLTNTETKLHDVIASHTEEVKTESKKRSIGETIGKAVFGSVAVVAGTVGLTKLSQNKQESNSDEIVVFETTETVIERTRTEITQWFTTMTTQVITTSETKKTEEVTVVVENYRKELNVIVEKARKEGVKHCNTKKEREEYLSQLTVIESVASSQTVQVEHVVIEAIQSNSDVKTKIEELVKSSTQKINSGFEEFKSRITFSSVVHAEEVVEKTKKAASAVEAKRVAATGWFSRLTETINSRIQEGGDNVKEDITKITEKAEEEISTVLKEEDEEDDETIKGSVGIALVSIKDSIAAQLTQVKNVITETTDTSELQEKFTQVSEKSKQEIDTTFTSVTDKVQTDVKRTEKDKYTVKAVENSVVDTTKEANETIKSWYKTLTSKLSDLAGNDSEESKAEAEVIIAEAELELKEKINSLKEETKTSSKTENTEHIDSYFTQITNSAKNQLTAVKTAVADNVLQNKSTFEESVKKNEIKLDEDITTHSEVVKSEAKKHSISETLGKVLLGSTIVAGGVLGAVTLNKKHEQKKAAEIKSKKRQRLRSCHIETTETVIENTRTEITSGSHYDNSSCNQIGDQENRRSYRCREELPQ
ncbi:hypothetical protein F4703DRAFT_1116883 [Phycomyces blakesleeanus]